MSEDQTTTDERIAALSAALSRSLGASAERIGKALHDLTQALEVNAQVIRDAHAAHEAAKAGTENRHGRAAQTSPYDVGSRK